MLRNFVAILFQLLSSHDQSLFSIIHRGTHETKR